MLREHTNGFSCCRALKVENGRPLDWAVPRERIYALLIKELELREVALLELSLNKLEELCHI